MANEQSEPQRLLFVFLKAGLAKNATEEEKERFEQGLGGELEPVMCVDKTPDELKQFSDLVEESKKTEMDWQIVIVAALSGKGGITPNSDEAHQPLKMMVETVRNGGDLSLFKAFTRQGEPIYFG